MFIVSKAHTTILILVLALLQSGVLAGEPENISVTESRDGLVFKYGGKPLLIYACATNQFKPYVQALY